MIEVTICLDRQDAIHVWNLFLAGEYDQARRIAAIVAAAIQDAEAVGE